MIIINRDINPEREIYYLGALVIETLKNVPDREAGFFDVFQALNEQKKVSINLFTLTLDWLYLLGVINNKDGLIEKCF